MVRRKIRITLANGEEENREEMENLW